MPVHLASNPNSRDEWQVVLLSCTATDRLKEKVTTWSFEKRDYMFKPPPRNFPAPPATVDNDMLRVLVDAVNEATQNIPCWDEYVKTGFRPFRCYEVIPDSIYPQPPPRPPHEELPVEFYNR